MTTLTKEEYLERTSTPQPGFGATQDFTDHTIGATAQSEGGVPARLEGPPGQVFAVHQLPDPEVAAFYNIPAVKVPEHLITEGAVDMDSELHPQGPDPLDLITHAVRQQLGHPRMAVDGSTLTDGTEAEPAEADDVEKPLDEQTHAELSATAGGLGLDTSGTKADLKARIEAHLSA